MAKTAKNGMKERAAARADLSPGLGCSAWLVTTFSRPTDRYLKRVETDRAGKGRGRLGAWLRLQVSLDSVTELVSQPSNRL